MVSSGLEALSREQMSKAAREAWTRSAAIALPDLGMRCPPFQGSDVVIIGDAKHYEFQMKNYRAGAAWRARNIVQGWTLGLRGLHGQASDPAKALTRQLLRTVEEICGVPCITSGLLHGLNAGEPSVPLRVVDEAHRLSQVLEVTAATGGGKTEAALTVAEGLLQRMGRLNRAKTPSGSGPERVGNDAAQLMQVANDAEALAEFLREITQDCLSDTVPYVRHLVAVPPHQSSPCGVLRLAASIVPNAPGQGPTAVPANLALAA